ncbi:PKD domain-containing protein [Methanoculleus sp. 10]|uniref:PKD domain-containing protein n=1 Tax=Methanoculleus sp. 10 TaxID=430615 RepID=UPI0025E1C1D8|nr:PKD domain-containing protein [Methanoculleus sp. 10]
MLTGGASALPEDSWLENITVTSGTFVQTVTFGTNENGSDGYDQGLDLLAPPASPDPESPNVYFQIAQGMFKQLYGDIRYILNADNPEHVWTLQVRSTNDDALLAWDPATLPADVTFILSAAGSEYDMKEVTSVSLTKSTGYVPVTIRARYPPTAAPVANFTANRTSGTAPLAVRFTDTSTGNPTTWAWDFGDGNTSTEQNPVHTYTTAGVYTVRLTVRNAEGEDSIVKEDAITVETAPPVWRENITVTSGTFVQTVTFGTDENGSDGYDQGLDLLAPPASPDPESPDVYFQIAQGMFKQLYGDIRYILNADNPEHVWTLQVRSTNDDALLAWDPATLPADIAFTLSAAGSEYDMKEVASASLTKSTGYVPVTIRARYSQTAAPVANFTANRTSGTAPLAVRFTDTSTGEITAWSWDFGDGNTSSERDPVHTYITPGNYTVALTVSNGHAEDTMRKEHYIQVQKPLPSAELIFNVNYNRGTSNDSIASGTSPCSLTYYTGVHNPRENQESILGDLVFVLDAPEIVSVSSGTCAEINGTRVTWTIRSPAAINPGTGSSTSAATSATADRTSGVTLERSCNRTVFTEAGVQQVTLNITFDTVDLDNLWGRIECTNTTDVGSAFVPGTISTDLPLRGLSEGRAGVHFMVDRFRVETGRQYTLSCAVEVDPLRPVAYAPACAVWEVRNSTSAVAPAGTAVTLPAELLPQSVNSVAFSSATPCEWTCIQNEHIITSLYQRAVPVSAPAANFTADVTSGTAPLAARFTDTSTGEITAWSWSFGDGNTSTEQHPTHTYTAPGIYTVSLTATNAGGSSTESKTDYITVMAPPPVANFSADVTVGPAPLAVRFTDASTGEITVWSWSFGDGNTSTEQNPVHTYGAPGNYTVNLTVSTGTGSAMLSRPGYITVTAPKGDVTGDGIVDISDVARVAYMVVGKEPEDLAADFNGNGAVDIGDAAKIAYFFVGKIGAL